MIGMLWAHASLAMNSDKPDTRDFSVIQFAMVEEAFEVARKLADEEAERLEQIKSDSAGLGEPKLVQLIDTEWGYDLRIGWLIVTRFWVHDASATQPLLTEP